ncbi:iron-siderophore ABC transporter substrate-binding protein [Devosia sp.]|uniref:ABC transporter substrate-binding protein n=1 Tax=Devosia sp. TaxID=1871048 RepID=UPI001AD31281|nr:iron-siderophore ABC transporter substrate-binding protein [Devosia sp.]MBN9334274.1 iron-siderophore ABC transporter substrate-binding protein [Devosia sp.]
MSDFIAPTEVPAGKGSNAEDGVFPRDVTHFFGTMTVQAKPQRLVVLATGQLDQAINLGVVPVGTTINGFPDAVPSYLADKFPQHAEAIAAIKPVGARTELDFHAIAALKPDVIVGTAAGAHGRAFNELNAIAPTFLTEGYGYNWKQDFRLFAELLGEREKATQIMAAYHARAARMRQRLIEAGRNGDEVSFGRNAKKGLEIYGEKAFVGTIAWDLGLARPASQRFDAIIRQITPDQLADMDGDWLFFSEAPAMPRAQEDRAAIEATWPQLKAVRNGKTQDVLIEPWFTMVAPTAASTVLDGIEAALLA